MKKRILIMVLCVIFFSVNFSVDSASRGSTTALPGVAPIAGTEMQQGAIFAPPTTGKKNEEGTLEVASVN